MLKRLAMGLAAAAVPAALAFTALPLATTTASGASAGLLIYYDSGANVGRPTGVILYTPDTFANCSATTTNSRIYTTGLSAGQSLVGNIIVSYVTNLAGNKQTFLIVPVNITGPTQLDVTLNIPPSSTWPVREDGSVEIHTDIQVELFENGLKVATLGPGAPWDEYCYSPPPPPPPPSIMGCTPGYWKNLTQHQWAWSGVSPYATVKSIFGVTPQVGGGATLTLIGALNLGGGGEAAFLRQAVSGYLDALKLNGAGYPLTAAGVISFVQQTYGTGQFESAKNLLESYTDSNPLVVCPLGNAPR